MTILKNISDKEYNKLEGLRATILKEFGRSPLHAKYMMENPKEATEAMLFGRWMHSYLLEKPKFFDSHFYLNRKLDLRKKEDKETKKSLVKHFGENIVQEDKMTQLIGMEKSLANNQGALKVLQSVTDTELSLTWKESDVKCKARLDAYSLQLKAIIDLKTCQDASPEGFAKQIGNFGYHLQASHYLAGAKANNLELENFIFIAIEKEPPYACAVYMLGIESFSTADTQRLILLDRFEHCQRINHWCGYSDRIEPINLPDWKARQIETSLENGE